MTRKTIATAIAIVAMLFSVLSLSTATAQAAPCENGYTSTKVAAEDPAFYHNAEEDVWYVNYDNVHQCNPVKYPGGFENMPAAPQGAYGWGYLVTPSIGHIANPAGTRLNPAPVVAAPAAAEGTGGGDATAPLAHTGSESAVLGYAGLGLVAFGAVALGSRRKFF